MKERLVTVLGVVGSLISTALGGFDVGLMTLMTFMAIDYLSGLIVAGIFHKSKKSENGALESFVGFKGLVKKGMCLLIVLLGCQLDAYIGSDIIRDGVIIAFISNELISIIENAGLMGIPMPDVVKRAIDILNKKSDKGGKK